VTVPLCSAFSAAKALSLNSVGKFSATQRGSLDSHDSHDGGGGGCGGGGCWRDATSMRRPAGAVDALPRRKEKKP